MQPGFHNLGDLCLAQPGMHLAGEAVALPALAAIGLGEKFEVMVISSKQLISERGISVRKIKARQ